MNKPLTKKDREGAIWIANRFPTADPTAERLMRELLSAEAYWREAVKNAGSDESYRCNFCDGILEEDPSHTALPNGSRLPNGKAEFRFLPNGKGGDL